MNRPDTTGSGSGSVIRQVSINLAWTPVLDIYHEADTGFLDKSEPGCFLLRYTCTLHRLLELLLLQLIVKRASSWRWMRRRPGRRRQKLKISRNFRKKLLLPNPRVLSEPVHHKLRGNDQSRDVCKEIQNFSLQYHHEISLN